MTRQDTVMVMAYPLLSPEDIPIIGGENTVVTDTAEQFADVVVRL